MSREPRKSFSRQVDAERALERAGKALSYVLNDVDGGVLATFQEATDDFVAGRYPKAYALANRVHRNAQTISANKTIEQVATDLEKVNGLDTSVVVELLEKAAGLVETRPGKAGYFAREAERELRALRKEEARRNRQKFVAQLGTRTGLPIGEIANGGEGFAVEAA